MKFNNLHVNKALSLNNSPGLPMVPSPEMLPKVSMGINFNIFDSKHLSKHEFLPEEGPQKAKSRIKIHMQAIYKLKELKRNKRKMKQTTFVTGNDKTHSDGVPSNRESFNGKSGDLDHSVVVQRKVERILENISDSDFGKRR